jgi:hypothetical protein
MTNDEARMTNEKAMTNDERRVSCRQRTPLLFGLAVSSFIRHSGFVIRQCGDGRAALDIAEGPLTGYHTRLELGLLA